MPCQKSNSYLIVAISLQMEHLCGVIYASYIQM